jgi:hypothetical protein
MQLRAVLLLALLGHTVPLAAQEPVAAPAAENATANPLAVLNAQVQDVLATAGVPFSDDQERAIALMMEERRRASEELFGNLMDFRAGPTQGQEEDRLRSAIEWMRNEFLTHLADYLTAPQSAAWTAFTTAQVVPAAVERERTQRNETQYVRINNNPFTAENNGFGSGSSTEVIQRGGAGAWHGNSQFLLKDDALNARNAFAGNKPPYQERRLSMDVSGPSIPGRLSSSLNFQQTESENVGTIRATLPDGVFALGITRPNTFRNLQTRHTVQLGDKHSIRVFARRATETSRGQGIGDFTLPERRADSFGRDINFGAFPFSTLSSRSIHEARVQVNINNNQTVPFSEAVRINVLDAFNGGGAQNRAEDANKSIEFGNLYTRLGETFTVKAGVEGVHRIDRSISANNTVGTFTFSSLEAYLAGAPITFRVTQGNPLVELVQLEAAAFVQTDVKLNSQVSLMFGARYEAQHHLDDYNNLDPRFGFAWSPSRATVIRGGGGVFHNRLQTNLVKNQIRFDGSHQYELVIDNPSYPDAFTGGTVRQTFPSLRVTDPDLAAPYNAVGMISLERTFFSNLLFTAGYDLQREYGKLRTRNLNAPYDARFEVRQACSPATPVDACVKPDPARGNLINLESTGSERRQNLRLSMRKRFSIFNGSVNYQGQRIRGNVPFGVGSIATDAYDLNLDWGGSQNATHQVSGSLNATLPMGVFVSGAMAYHSGRHYTITTGTDNNRDSNVTDRPAGVEPYSERGPRYMNFDFNISKAFFLRRAPGSSTSGTNINVFANMTNAFNHVHYNTPSGVMTSTNFGDDLDQLRPDHERLRSA